MNEVMKILKDENISQNNQVFEMNCSINISFRRSMKELMLKRFSAIDDLTLQYLETR
jgi:hypothetical protein